MTQTQLNHKSVGIIIPTYNVEPYIKDCLDSIINQTYTNWKAVIVNDGSTDNTLHVAEDYQKQYPDKFHIITQKNGGLTSSRITGIEYFKQNPTDYIIFIDPDDWWETNCLEECVTNIGDADILGFKLRIYWEAGGNRREVKHQTNFCGAREGHIWYQKAKTQHTRLEWLRNLPQPANWTMLSVTLYKSRLLTESYLEFLETGHCGEDGLLGKQLYLSSENIVILNKVLYNYRRRPKSLTTSSSSIKPNEHLAEVYANFSSNKTALRYIQLANLGISLKKLRRWVETNKSKFSKEELELINLCFYNYYIVELRGFETDLEADPYNIRDILLEAKQQSSKLKRINFLNTP